MRKTFVALFGLLLALVLAVPAAQAQNTTGGVPYDSTKKKIVYTAVINAPGKSKDQLFDKATAVLNEMLTNVAGKYTTNDKASGKKELKHFVKLMLPDKKTKELVQEGSRPVKFKWKIDFKDGKYRYEIYDLHVDAAGYGLPMEKYYEHDNSVKNEMPDERIAAMHKEITALIDQFVAAMAEEKTQEKSDW